MAISTAFTCACIIAPSNNCVGGCLLFEFRVFFNRVACLIYLYFINAHIDKLDYFANKGENLDGW